MIDSEAGLAALTVENSAIAFRVSVELYNFCRSTAINKNVVIQVPNFRYHLRQPRKQMGITNAALQGKMVDSLDYSEPDSQLIDTSVTFLPIPQKSIVQLKLLLHPSDETGLQHVHSRRLRPCARKLSPSYSSPRSISLCPSLVLQITLVELKSRVFRSVLPASSS